MTRFLKKTSLCRLSLLWRIAFFVLSLLTHPTVSLVSPIYETIQKAQVIDPRTGETCSPLSTTTAATTTTEDDRSTTNSNKKSLVVLLPQLGEFDSSEFCEYLVAVESELKRQANIHLCIIGIGESDPCAKRFSQFTGVSLDVLRVDPEGTLHQQLNLHAGPNWDVPEGVSEEVLSFLLRTLPGGVPSDRRLVRVTARAWWNYLAMCAGIGAPGTLREIVRGYVGDTTAPERFPETERVVAAGGFLTIGPGVGPVQIGPFSYNQWWSDERGYQRPVELATVRLKNMVEVLTNWDAYVTNPTRIAQRGATYLFEDETGEVLYEYRHKGVLTYSETMSRPLLFLEPYIGTQLANNPLGFLDDSYDPVEGKVNQTHTKKPGRGIWKPLGKFMSLLTPLFQLENKLQSQLLGAEDFDYQAARKEIQETIASNHVVIYTYGLSPFSWEAIAVLESAGCTNYKKVELGLEWFLLGKQESVMRSELLSMTNQSSLPHIFIGGKHVGGLFSGPSSNPVDAPGIAALQESGQLQVLVTEREQ